MVRERCSCGAEFESDSKQAMRLVREWRATHTCQPTLTDLGTRTTQTDTTPADNRTPELHIGFRPVEDDD